MFQLTHLFPILPPPPIDWVWHLGNTPHPLIVSPPQKEKCKCDSSITFLLTCSYMLYLPRTFLNSGFQLKFMAENKTNDIFLIICLNNVFLSTLSALIFTSVLNINFSKSQLTLLLTPPLPCQLILVLERLLRRLHSLYH